MMPEGALQALDGVDATTLIELVRLYSPSGQEREAVAALVARMKALGFTRAYTDEVGNAVGVMGQGPRQVVLLGHIDTVPGEIDVRVEGDLLYGRGAVDAKGPLAAFVDAIASTGPLPGWQWVVIGAVDEERDSRGARHVVRQYRPDMAIIGEPSAWERVTLGYKGSAQADLIVKRPRSHSAREEESACEAAVRLWGIVRAWVDNYNEDRRRPFDQLQARIMAMDSGDDGFQTWARLRLGMRLPLDLLPQACYEHLQNLVAPHTLEPVGFAIPAYRAVKNTPLVRAFLASIRALDGEPRFVVKSGTADLNIVAPLWDCPAVAYGPGDSRLDHTPDEHLSLVEYGGAVDVLKGVLMSLAGRSA